MQGIVSINQKTTIDGSIVSLNAVENAAFKLDAPNSSVSLNLRSLHDSSYIKCKSLDLVVSDSLDNCAIYDCKSSKIVYSPSDYTIGQNAALRPILFVECETPY